jgi:hypothetical protein
MGNLINLTSCSVLDLVLEEPISQRDDIEKETSTEKLSILESFPVWRAQGEAAQCPGNGGHQVRNHENVMPEMVIGRCDVCPSSTSKCSKDADACHELGKGTASPASHAVP